MTADEDGLQNLVAWLPAVRPIFFATPHQLLCVTLQISSGPAHYSMQPAHISTPLNLAPLDLVSSKWDCGWIREGKLPGACNHTVSIHAFVHVSVLFSVSASGLSILRIRKWLVGVDELLRVIVHWSRLSQTWHSQTCLLVQLTRTATDGYSDRSQGETENHLPNTLKISSSFFCCVSPNFIKLFLILILC